LNISSPDFVKILRDMFLIVGSGLEVQVCVRRFKLSLTRLYTTLALFIYLAQNPSKNSHTYLLNMTTNTHTSLTHTHSLSLSLIHTHTTSQLRS